MSTRDQHEHYVDMGIEFSYINIININVPPKLDTVLWPGNINNSTRY